MLNRSFHEISALGRLKEGDRFTYLQTHHIPQGIQQILHLCLADEERRATSAELLTHHGLEIFCRIAKLEVKIEDEDTPSISHFPDIELPALHYFLTCDSEAKQDCAMIQMLELLRTKKTGPVNYIISNRLYTPIIKRILHSQWDFKRERLMYSAIKLGTLMIYNGKNMRHKLKKRGFLKVFIEAKAILSDKRELYEFACQFLKNNTLTVMQLAYKHELFNFAREMAKEPQADCHSICFIKDSISYLGSNSIKLIEHHLNETHEVDALSMLSNIPIQFRVRSAFEVVSVLTDIEKSLGRVKKLPSKKLRIFKELIINVIELIFYWPWLKLTHAQGICTGHRASQFMNFCKNPLLFYCNDCGLYLCVTCASMHYHPFTSLKYCGYCSEAVNCGCVTSTMSNCSCNSGPTEMKSLDFLKKADISSTHRLVRNGVLLTQSASLDYFPVNLGSDEGFVILEGMEPLIEPHDLQLENTLAYFEVDIKSGGIQDKIGVGITGFEYRGDTGFIRIDGIAQGIAPLFGSYDNVGLGITATHIYLTFNGLLLRPLHRHPIHTDYRLKIILEGSETSVNVKLNTNSWIFKPPESISTIENDRFIPEAPDYINEPFIKKMKSRLKDCKRYRKHSELAEKVDELELLTQNVLSFDYKHLMRLRKAKMTEQDVSRKRRGKSPDPCMLF